MLHSPSIHKNPSCLCNQAKDRRTYLRRTRRLCRRNKATEQQPARSPQISPTSPVMLENTTGAESRSGEVIHRRRRHFRFSDAVKKDEPQRNKFPPAHLCSAAKHRRRADTGDKGQKQHHLGGDEAPTRTPVQKLPDSPIAPERSTIGARKSWSFIPLRRRRHRLADCARKDSPPGVITTAAKPSSTNSSRRRP